MHQPLKTIIADNPANKTTQLYEDTSIPTMLIKFTNGHKLEYFLLYTETITPVPCGLLESNMPALLHEEE